jgi:hypothetical protein
MRKKDNEYLFKYFVPEKKPDHVQRLVTARSPFEENLHLVELESDYLFGYQAKISPKCHQNQ